MIHPYTMLQDPSLYHALTLHSHVFLSFFFFSLVSKCGSGTFTNLELSLSGTEISAATQWPPPAVYHRRQRGGSYRWYTPSLPSSHAWQKKRLRSAFVMTLWTGICLHFCCCFGPCQTNRAGYGLPKFTHDNDAERAILTGLEVRRFYPFFRIYRWLMAGWIHFTILPFLWRLRVRLVPSIRHVQSALLPGKVEGKDRDR